MTDDWVDQTCRRIDIELYHNVGMLMATELMEPEYANLPRCNERIQIGFGDVFGCDLPRGHNLLGQWHDRVPHHTSYSVERAEKYYREHPDVVGGMSEDWQKLRHQWQDLVLLYHWLIAHQLTRHGEHDYNCGRCGGVVSDVFVHAAWHESPRGDGTLVSV